MHQWWQIITMHQQWHINDRQSINDDVLVTIHQWRSIRDDTSMTNCQWWNVSTEASAMTHLKQCFSDVVTSDEEKSFMTSTPGGGKPVLKIRYVAYAVLLHKQLTGRNQNGLRQVMKLPYYIKYSAHFFTLKMRQKYSLHTILEGSWKRV